MGETSQRVMREMKGLQTIVDAGEALFTEYEDIKMLIEMAYEEEEDSIIGECESVHCCAVLMIRTMQ